MKVVTSEEMRELDKKVIGEAGIPGVVLMENAGLAVVKTIRKRVGRLAGHRICVFAGKGNNGGDGFVAARHLVNSGAKVQVFLLGKREEVLGDAQTNLNILISMGHAVDELSSNDLHKVKVAVSVTDIIVDAIFGTGMKGAAEGYDASVIQLINESGKPVIAVDVPSGLDATSGEVRGRCIKATETVTMALPKSGLLLHPGAQYVGKLTVADIGIPKAFLADDKLKLNLTTPGEVRAMIPERERDAHKGIFGRVVVVAGSEGMTGAATLTSLAALRIGAGLVTLAVPRSLHDSMEIKLTEVMTKPLPETEARTLSLQAQAAVEVMLRRSDSFAIGPGLSLNSETSQLVRNLVTNLTLPSVIDADALTALAHDMKVLTGTKAPLVLTPHIGEMARLAGTHIEEIRKHKLTVTRQAAKDWGKVLVLKGAGTIIADPSGQVYINPTGNPGMATGGTGDVLTGAIAGLIAQGLEPFEAAVAGVYLHGLAGDLVAMEMGEMGMTAGDVLERLPRACHATCRSGLEIGDEEEDVG